MFYWLWFPFNVIVCALPFYIIRGGEYLKWRRSDAPSEGPKTWWTYFQEKPEEYWMPSTLFWAIQLGWASVVLFPFQLIGR
ncbi:MAG: hypothetical protein NXH87_12695 [Rhodobiaceae bacterium]|nr:hypothetical protein [Rhodobiaceae bacterium]